MAWVLALIIGVMTLVCHKFHFVMTILGILVIYPLIWSVASSFKDNSEIFVNSYSLFPHDWGVIENYLSEWKGGGGVSFGWFLWNSAVVAGIGTFGGVMSSMMAAYAFAECGLCVKGINRGDLTQISTLFSHCIFE